VEAPFLLFGLLNASIGTFYNTLINIMVFLVYLPLMVFLTSPSLTFFLKFQFRIFDWLKSVFFNKSTFKKLLYIFKEELFWRSALIILLKHLELSKILILVIAAFLFYVSHLFRKNEFNILAELELFLFSLLICFLYLEYTSFVGIWLGHSIRNTFISFHKIK
jgi:hypothetical protein